MFSVLIEVSCNVKPTAFGENNNMEITHKWNFNTNLVISNMSQNELNNLKLCEDGPSKASNLIGNCQSMQDEPTPDRTAFLPHFPSTNLFKTFVPAPTASQANTCLLQPTFLDQNPHAFCEQEERSSVGVWEDGRADWLESSEEESCECDCGYGRQASCPLCLNARQISGKNNIVNFFQYVIAFKIGNAPSYTSQSTNWQSPRPSNKSYPAAEGRKSHYNLRESNLSISERASLRSRKLAKSQFGKELDNLATVHENYCCDLCHGTPIVGVRYHCSECDNYDECQQCHSSSEHKHLMERVDRSGKQRQLQSMVQMLARPLGRKPLKPLPSINGSTPSYLPNRIQN